LRESVVKVRLENASLYKELEAKEAAFNSLKKQLEKIGQLSTQFREQVNKVSQLFTSPEESQKEEEPGEKKIEVEIESIESKEK
ncbi:MAG: hypothetical protein J7K71_00020, partial [Candidatus Omnitrophica bacterium]|nr:hypothetical protein [Candidatus Omnitrophota bacterium]